MPSLQKPRLDAPGVWGCDTDQYQTGKATGVRLYIDSALTSDWETWAKRGMLYGATTNPLIFQKQDVDLSRKTINRLVDKAKDLNLQSLQLQVHGLDQPKEAAKTFTRFFDRWSDGVVAKVPLTPEGLAVLPHLGKDVPITLTAAYSQRQAVLAAALKGGEGARYIAPYYGRLLEAGEDADGIVDAMLRVCGGKTRVLVASLRSAEQVAALAARGHDTFTLSPAVFDEMLNVPQSLDATQAFETAAATLRAQGKSGGIFSTS